MDREVAASQRKALIQNIEYYTRTENWKKVHELKDLLHKLERAEQEAHASYQQRTHK